MQVQVSARQESSRERCVYCHDALGDEDLPLRCTACSAAYHGECVPELKGGRCAARGCVGRPSRAGARPRSDRVTVRLAPAPAAVWARRLRAVGLAALALLLLAGATALALSPVWAPARIAASRRAEIVAAREARDRAEVGAFAGALQRAAFEVTPADVEALRATYLRLRARGLVDEEFVGEQLRRGGWDPQEWERYARYDGPYARVMRERLEAKARLLERITDPTPGS